MKPALFSYPHVASYSFFLFLGFAFGWILARRRAPSFAIQGRHIDNICLIIPLTALFGARLFARLFYAKLPLLEALKVWEGDGLVFYGGFIFGAGSAIIYAVSRGLRLGSLCDCLAPSVALGLAFGRIGCFMAGCCWGDLCVDSTQLAGHLEPTVLSRVHTISALSHAGWPLAVSFPPDSEAFNQHVKLGLISTTAARSLPVHPVQLYEAVLAAILAAWLHLRFRNRRKAAQAGSASIAFLFGYAGIRFLTEFFRADNKPYALGLTFSQVVSIEIACAAFALIAIRYFFFNSPSAAKAQGKRKKDYFTANGADYTDEKCRI
jgi:phosphatidylglycerol:prolipoprotein diacylglycerol transferase